MIAVTGATGNVGRALVDQLVAARHPVRALVRDPRRAAMPAEADTVTVADYGQQDDLAPLFAGTKAVFLHLGAVDKDMERVLDGARRAGVERAVLLSSGIIRNDDETLDSEHPIHVWHSRAERRIRESGLAWTFVRPNAFAVNSLHWAPQIKAGDLVRDVFAGATSAPIHEADIAAVALRALLDDGHDGVAHRLTGPESLTSEEQVRDIGAALGRKIGFEEIPADEATPDLYPYVPEAMFADFLKATAEQVGVRAEVTTTVAEVTGRPARTFREWAGDHAADFTKGNG